MRPSLYSNANLLENNLLYIYIYIYIVLGFFFGETILNRDFLPSALLKSPTILIYNSATTGPKRGIKKGGGQKNIPCWKIS